MLALHLFIHALITTKLGGCGATQFLLWVNKKQSTRLAKALKPEFT